MQWEEALLKQKVQMSEAAQANQKLTALVNELTLDRDRVVGEMSALKADLMKKDDEMKKALDGAKRSNERAKMLASQLEGGFWPWRNSNRQKLMTTSIQSISSLASTS